MDINLFKEELELLNIKVNNNQLVQLNKYYELLIEYNKVMNLTGITEKEEVYLKHFYDSLTIVKAIDLNKEKELCDIGTGAGFPGMVIKILYPDLNVTLVDSLNKRIKFLDVVIKELDLKKIVTVHARCEEYASKNREKFDVVTSRAVTHLSPLIEFSIPMVKVGKYCIPLKANITNELEESKKALKILNSKIIEIIEFKLPIENSNRNIIKIKKELKTNTKYPRKFSEIKKNRL